MPAREGEAMRWHRGKTYRYKPEDSLDERLAASRIETHREEELRSLGEVWDETIKQRLDEPLPQANRVRRRRRAGVRNRCRTWCGGVLRIQLRSVANAAPARSHPTTAIRRLSVP